MMTTERTSLEPKVSGIVKRVGGLEEIEPDQDYYDAGLTSLAALNLLLELEDAFGISIPDDKFIGCRNVNALMAMVEELQG